MSIGFTYRIERSRENTDLRRMLDSTSNFLRAMDPASPAKFYNFAAAILGGTEHVLKLSDSSGAFYASIVIQEVKAREVVTATPIVTIQPFYGNGDAYEILRRELNGSLTAITSGRVSGYLPITENTYKLVFTLTSVAGLPPDLFVVKQSNKITLDASLGIQSTAGAPVYERVATASETVRLVTPVQFVFDTRKAGFQWYRDKRFIKNFKTQDAALAAEASLLGQLVSLTASLLTPNILAPAFSVTPGSGTIQIGQQVQLDAIGEKGEVSWRLVQNDSGGTINASGLYIAGASTGTDTIEVRDTVGNLLTLMFSVQNSYASTFDGVFQWQQT